ncbi:MAG: hypothetical protein DRQ55_08525 [Planctomycetota bacterium]|nr:MAG: hypothetical protein DRQ55_08525 [Planctomycetota bacterium]
MDGEARDSEHRRDDPAASAGQSAWHDTAQPPAVTYSADEALAMDRWLVSRGFSIAQLMATAGARLAAAATELLEQQRLERVVCLVGPGNNGGDALVAAELLESAWPLTRWRPLAGDEAPAMGPGVLVIDGLFGVGLERPVQGDAAAALAAVASTGAPVLAVDVPSGLHATTGEVLGAALPARWTLSFVGPKTGFFVAAGPAYVGSWRAVEIGFPAQQAHAWLAARRATQGPARA